MQISTNYQIFTNNTPCNYNCKNNNNSLKYQGQNIAFGQLSEQKSLTSLPKQFKMAVMEQYKTLNLLLCKYMPSLQTKKQYQTALKEQYLNAAEHCKKNAEQIFNRNIVLGPEEYKNLSNEDLNTLRKYIDIFCKDKNTYKCANFIKSFGKLFSERLHEKYPDGFIFVSVGRSPAFLAKYLEFQGEEVKYCPISELRGKRIEKFPPFFVQEYKKYLDTIGLTKELAQNTQKPIIISDYTYYGYSLRNFKNLLALPQIGIEEREMIKFSPIFRHFWFKDDNWIFEEIPCIEKEMSFDCYAMLQSGETKTFSSIPRLSVRKFEPNSPAHKTLQTYYQNGNKFEEDFNTKMMNFIIADSIHNK